MSGPTRQFVDFSSNTAGDSGENNTASILPIANGESVNGATASRPSESLRQRSEAIKDTMGDTLYLRDADRKMLLVMPAGTGVTWPGSTTAAASGIPVLTGTLWMIPMLTPGFNQTSPIPPVASAYGTLYLKRASDSMDSILVTSQRRSYAAGDQISVEVSAGSVFSCTLDAETGYQRTIKIVATGATTLTTVINALNALTPSAPDNTQLVTAALEGGAAGGDLILTAQAKQFVSGNYDGEGHSLSTANLASFFVSNPTSALAEGDTLCVEYAMVSDTASTGGRRQSIPENSNTALSAGQLFNSRVNPEKLVNAIPLFKVIDNRLVTPDGHLLPTGASGLGFGASGAAMPLDFTNGNHVGCTAAANWADATTNPATDMTAMVLKIISDLSSAGGTAKVYGSAVGTALAAGTLYQQLSDIVNKWALPNIYSANVGILTKTDDLGVVDHPGTYLFDDFFRDPTVTGSGWSTVGTSGTVTWTDPHRVVLAATGNNNASYLFTKHAIGGAWSNKNAVRIRAAIHSSTSGNHALSIGLHASGRLAMIRQDQAVYGSLSLRAVIVNGSLAETAADTTFTPTNDVMYWFWIIYHSATQMDWRITATQDTSTALASGTLAVGSGSVDTGNSYPYISCVQSGGDLDATISVDAVEFVNATRVA